MRTERLGKPCWDVAQVAKVVTNIAKMDRERSHYFLASHSPITNIIDERRNVSLDEEGLCKAIYDPSRAETLAVIWGEPGAGKSHLIHWLKLRTEHALAEGELKDVMPVLVQRRSGNLKDALQQLVEQLPGEFAQYMDPVRQALDKISATTAREVLANAIAIELLPQQREKQGLKPLERRLAKARELCLSPGTRAWLCRPGGVIDALVCRLTGTARPGAEDKEPLFSISDFTSIAPQYKRDNSDSAREVLDEIDFDGIQLAKRMAEAFNEALPTAVRELSGLGGTTLREVFDAIRTDLKKSGRSLALFIEDVSVMSDLDAEVLRAVEPQSNPKLCPMVAILGMTDVGKGRLRENELGRIDLLVQMRTSVKNWRDSGESVAAFAARYLNAIRLPEAEVREVARHRRTGGDVNRSHCAGCPAKNECFEAFKFVKFDGVEVGLFPFTPPAPGKLLRSLDTSKGDIRQNQRGFLDQVLRKSLQTEELEGGSFPERDQFSLLLDDPLHWNPFTASYCGSWSDSDKQRLKFLAQGWTGAQSEAEYLAELGPLLPALGFDKFTKKAPVSRPRPGVEPNPPKPIPTPTSIPAPKGGLKELQSIQNALAAWIAKPGAALERDAPIRDLLVRFVRRCLPIENTRGIPFREFKRLIDTKSSVYVEGQKAQPAAVGFELRFERTEETRALIEALAYSKYVGSDTWDFSHGEHYRRIVSMWLRRNGQEVLQRMQPIDLDVGVPVREGIRLLCLAAVVRRRQALPKNDADCLNEIFASFDQEPALLAESSDWGRRLRALKSDFADVRRCVLSEIDVAQGMTGEEGTFIDPRVPIEVARDFARNWAVSAVPEAYFAGHWKGRYEPLDGVEHFADLPNLLVSERSELRRLMVALRRALTDAGMEFTDPSGAIETYIKEVAELVRTLKAAKFAVPDPVFESYRPNLSDAIQASGELRKAELVAESTGVESILCFDPTRFQWLSKVLAACDQFTRKVESEVEKMDRLITAEGDPDALMASLLSRLDELAQNSAAGE